jgi:hypothetical protein
MQKTSSIHGELINGMTNSLYTNIDIFADDSSNKACNSKSWYASCSDRYCRFCLLFLLCELLVGALTMVHSKSF